LGSGFTAQLSKDLQSEFPTVTIFSKRVLELTRQQAQVQFRLNWKIFSGGIKKLNIKREI
jgi:hypothetical protein